jgi:hypothetical protein
MMADGTEVRVRHLLHAIKGVGEALAIAGVGDPSLELFGDGSGLLRNGNGVIVGEFQSIAQAFDLLRRVAAREAVSGDGTA